MHVVFVPKVKNTKIPAKQTKQQVHMHTYLYTCKHAALYLNREGLTPVLIKELVQLFFVHGRLGGIYEVPHGVGEEVVRSRIYSPVVQR